MRSARPLTERFWSYVVKGDGCWLWSGSRTSDGYGRMGLPRTQGSKFLKAHRLSYEINIGPIPTDLVIDHLCRTPLCVNPDHLEPVTNRENILRGVAPNIQVHNSGVCKRGHSREGNAMKDRHCRPCHAMHERERKMKKRLVIVCGHREPATTTAK